MSVSNGYGNFCRTHEFLIQSSISTVSIAGTSIDLPASFTDSDTVVKFATADYVAGGGIESDTP